MASDRYAALGNSTGDDACASFVPWLATLSTIDRAAELTTGTRTAL